MLNSKTRLETAWAFKEPDRVPIEMSIPDYAKGLPGADKIVEFVENDADNFSWVNLFDWGFMGLDYRQNEDEVIEDIPGKYKRIRHSVETAAGEFYGITQHFYDVRDPNDFHWERRYIHSLDDFTRLAEAEFKIRPFDLDAYNRECIKLGNRGIAFTGVFHPLGTLVRSSTMEEVYIWLISEKTITEKYLAKTNRQVIDSILSLVNSELAAPPVFATWALEMLLPPWLGKKNFEQLVFPYDKSVNAAIHKIGGRHRAHSHGNTGQFLELFADMGIDSIEPLEPPPFGDNILKAAKRKVGHRMLLSGNIPSQAFYTLSREEVREMTRRAIEDAAAGGGFTLRLTGGGTGCGNTDEQAIIHIDRTRAFIDAALEFGKY